MPDFNVDLNKLFSAGDKYVVKNQQVNKQFQEANQSSAPAPGMQVMSGKETDGSDVGLGNADGSVHCLTITLQIPNASEIDSVEYLARLSAKTAEFLHDISTFREYVLARMIYLNLLDTYPVCSNLLCAAKATTIDMYSHLPEFLKAKEQ